MNFNEIESGLIIPVDKPYGWTSFDVVNFLRHRLIRISGNRKLKIGHAGTLDPLATGLVTVCTGKATKLIEEIQNQDKTYTGTILLGYQSPSYDLETPYFYTSDEVDPKSLSEEKLLLAAEELTGELKQIPPAHSAVRVNGRRSYKLARAGVKVEGLPRDVTVFHFKLTRIYLPQVDFEIKCSKGTYIRSIAKDFGDILGCGGLLAGLRRTGSGSFDLSKAHKINDLKIVLDNTPS